MATLNIKGFPDPIYAALRRMAEQEHRSMAQQVTHLLTSAVGAAEKVSILELRGLGRRSWPAVEAREQVRRERRDWD